MQDSSRQVPPWLRGGTRGLWLAFLAGIPVWLLASAVGYFTEARAPALHGHVVATSRTRGQHGSELVRIDYVYTDEHNGEHTAFRELVVDAAQGFGKGAPLVVHEVFGEPLIEGAPNVYFAFPLAVACVFALFVVIFAFVARAERRRIGLALHGTLAPGVIESFSVMSARGIDTWVIQFAYELQHGGLQATQRLGTSQLEGPLTALGLDRVPGPGDRITVAYDRRDPRRATIYTFDQLTEAPSVCAAPLPLPLALSEASRSLPVGAPRLTTEIPFLLVALLGAAFVFFGVGPLAYAALSHEPGSGAEAIFVGEMLFFVLVALSAPLLSNVLLRPRTILLRGQPLAATITHVSRAASRVWISFEGRSEQGPWRGRESIRTQRLSAMRADPQPGDTIYLVADRARPWERVIWGLSSPST